MLRRPAGIKIMLRKKPIGKTTADATHDQEESWETAEVSQGAQPSKYLPQKYAKMGAGGVFVQYDSLFHLRTKRSVIQLLILVQRARYWGKVLLNHLYLTVLLLRDYKLLTRANKNNVLGENTTASSVTKVCKIFTKKKKGPFSIQAVEFKSNFTSLSNY